MSGDNGHGDKHGDEHGHGHDDIPESSLQDKLLLTVGALAAMVLALFIFDWYQATSNLPIAEHNLQNSLHAE